MFQSLGPIILIIVLFAWLVLSLLKKDNWKALLARVIKILRKPYIFSIDSQEDNDLVYPRKFLEQLAQIKSDNTGAFGRFLAKQSSMLFDEKYPFRTISYVVVFGFFLLFVLGDVIAAAQTLELLQMEVDFLPESLNKLSISLMSGGVLAAVVGLWVLIEASGDADKPSKTLPFEDYNKAQLGIIKTFSVFIFVFSIVIAMAFAHQGMISMGIVDANQITTLVVNYILFGVLLINNFLAAAISFTFAIQGLLIILTIVAYVIIGILPVMIFFIDIIWRFLHVIFDAILTFLFSPISLFLSLFSSASKKASSD